MSTTQDILLYQSPDGQAQLHVQLQNETVWLTQAQMAELFERERSVITTKHLRNVFNSSELEEDGNVQKMHIALSDKPVAHYSLDVT